jgi:hypothetical protein
MSTKAANMGLALFHFGMATAVATTLEDNEFSRPNVSMIKPDGKTASFTVDVKWLIVAFTIITGMFHLMYAYRGFAGQLRYIEYAITASIMIMIIQLLSGEENFIVLAAVFALMASTMLLGYVQDEKIQNRGMSNAAFWFAWVPYIVAWGIVINRFLHTVSNADGDVPAFVKYIIWIELVAFTTFAMTQYWYLIRPGARYNQQRYDGTYNTLSVLAKGLLVGFAYFGLRGMGETTKPKKV